MPTVEFNALNISAKPHPPGVYRRLFEAFANKRVKYYGEKIAAFSKPSESIDGIFYGVLITWTEIDRNQSVIDTVLLKKPEPGVLSQIKIPDNLGFNAQLFYYAFREADHILVIETRNPENARLSSSSVERIFRSIFDKEHLSNEALGQPRPEIVEVDLVVQKDAVDKIFSIKHLHTIQISVATPNQDDNTEDADAIIERLRKIGAGREIITYRAEDTKVGLKPDDAMKRQGEAALRHGYVQGEGDDGEKKVSLNSKSYPKTERRYIGPDESTVDAIIRVARQFFQRDTKPEAN